MIKGKYGRADLNPATRFQVKYLGSTITQQAGIVGIENAVRRIRQEVKTDGKSWTKMVMEVQSSGVKFVEVKAKSPKESKFISLEKISYASSNRINPTVFAFNHHKSPSVVECHAVACDSEEKAKSIGLALYAAFREGHFNKLRQQRTKSLDQNWKETDKYDEQGASVDHSLQMSSVCNVSGEVSSDSTIFGNSSNWVESPQAPNDLTVDIGYDEQELEQVIRDLLMTVETEKAKIDKGEE